MNVDDFTASIQESPSILLDNIRDQFNRRVKVPLSSIDGDVVNELTGIYQQALKENGLEEGIQAEGTIEFLGYKQDVSLSWEPGILLSPDLATWVQGQSEELRQHVNYVISLIVVMYRELRSEVVRTIRNRINQFRDTYANPYLDEISERLESVEEFVNNIQSDPIGEVFSLVSR
ncbi:MAG: hypothetical protein ABEK50_10620 [bacterium]